jgi:hypothetical protein
MRCGEFRSRIKNQLICRGKEDRAVISYQTRVRKVRAGRYQPAERHFQMAAGSHFAKTDSWWGSMLVKATVIPVLGMTDMTQPNAVNVVFL